jgi:hypothetical protein
MLEENLPNPFDDATPPSSLKARTMETLTSGGALNPVERRVSRLARSAAVLAAALIAGFLLGRVDRAAASDVPRYLLLLYEDSAYHDDRPIAEIVGEYARWADSLRDARVLELGEKLAEGHIELGPGTGAVDDRPTGLFIVRAADASTARAIASSSPHIRHGGRIAVRPIEETGSR